MIWNKNISLEGLNSINDGTIVKHLDIQFSEIGEDYLKATMPVDEKTKQPMGLLHGGASAVLAETLGSVASVVSFENPFEAKVVGLEINANHLRAVSKGKVVGTVKPIKLGRRIHVWDIKIHDEDKKLCCVSRLTVMIL